MTEQKKNDDLIGKTLGQFEIIEEVGRGGMATVYRARQTSMNRLVAMKILPPHLLHDPGFYERFEREVEVISHLEHPHILPIYDYGQSDGVPYIAMRFLGGGSLEDEIRRRGQIPLDDLEKPLRQIAQALDYAHGQGIIHRDLKPGNIMLDEGGNAYLSDFGIARVMGSEMTGSMIIGTPSYMSPEQANGMPIDARADVYSLGVVLFELITGRLPFQAETPMAVLLKHINEDIPPIAEFRDDVSAVIEDVVRASTAKDPNDRFASAGDMASAYGKALRGETAAFARATEQRAATKAATAPEKDLPTIGVPTPGPSRAPDVSAPTAAAAVPTGSSNRLMLGLAAVIVIAVIIGGAFMAMSGSQSDTVDPNAVPTPFPGAKTFTGDQFTISAPDDPEWREAQFNFSQNPQSRAVNSWVNVNRENDVMVAVALTLVDAELSDDRNQQFFEAAVEEFVRRTYEERRFTRMFEPIDSTTAENGSIRRSFRLHPPRPGEDAEVNIGPGGEFRIMPGQVDVFFIQEPPFMAVLEMYTSDAVGSSNAMIIRLQSMLDSLRIRPQSGT